jgi:hypothetical protein
MKREEVYRILDEVGDGNSDHEWIDFYHIGYDKDLVAFIEMPNLYMDNRFVLFNGIDVFRTEAKSLVRLISDYGKLDDTDCELGYTYRFPSLGLGFWRSRVFEYGMMDEPIFKEMSKENQFDEIRHLYFEAVSVFSSDYYKK